MTTPAARRSSVNLIGGIAVSLLGLNLRPAVTSLGALLEQVQSATGMPAVLTIAVVAAPVVCFAAGGWMAWLIRRRWGTARSVSTALAVLAVSLTIRVLDGPYLVLAGTITTCVAIAVIAALLPPIVHSAPHHQWHLLTGCYTTALGVGSAAGGLLTHPLASSTSSWRLAAASWALVAIAALLAWRRAADQFADRPGPRAYNTHPTDLAPQWTAWALTVHFGLQAGYAFTLMGWLPSILRATTGSSAVETAWMFGTAMTVGIVLAPFVPTWARRTPSQSTQVVWLAVPSIVGTTGLLIAPAAAPWLWSSCIGVGMTGVVLALTLIQIRVQPNDVDSAAALSAMVHGIGYTIAALVAVGVGGLHATTHGWAPPLAALVVVLFGHINAGIIAGQPATVLVAHRPRRNTP